LKLGPGREETIKKKAMEEIFESLTLYVKSLYDTSPVALSIEIFELPPVLRINKHNLNNYIAKS
jgi:5-carboxymethyl-2-hydroxymuconate isomerase